MADGSIRIETSIDTRGLQADLKRLGKSIEKSASEIESLRSKMNELGSAKIPTQEYQSLQKELENANSELSKFVEKKKELQEMGFETIPKAITEDIDKASLKVNEIEKQIEKLVSDGKAFTLGTDTGEYAKYAQRVEKLTGKMNADSARAAEIQSTLAAEEQRLASIKENATITDQKIVEMLERRKILMQQISDMEKAGLSYGYKEYDNAKKELSVIEQQVKEYQKIHESRFSAKGILREFDKMKSSAKGAFSALSGSVRKSDSSINKGIKTVLRYGFGIRSLFVLLNKIRNAIKEGFNNLVQYSDPLNNSISALKSSLTQLKNSFATAFAPIVQTVIPYIQSLISTIVQALNYITQLSAVISGAGTWTKAVAVQEDYAASLKGTASAAKKAAGALASFDTLEVLSKKDSSASGAGGVSANEMFEEVPIEKSGLFKDFADKIVSALDKVKSAAQKALEALSELWNDGLAKLKDFTFDTLLDFYNHFLKPLGSWVLGEGLPRLFEITNNLLKSINWALLQRRLRDFYDVLEKMAKCVFDSLLDFYEDFLAPVAAWTMNKALPALLKTLTDLGNKVSWDLINHSLETLYKVLSKFIIGIGNGLIMFWNGIEPILTSSLAGIINAIAVALDGMLGAIGMIPEDVLVALGGAIAGFLTSFILYESVTGIMTAVGTAFGVLCKSITSGIALVAANPFAVAVSGIGALLGAMIALDQKASERLQIEEYGQALDTLCANLNNKTEAVKNQSNAIKGYVDDTGAAELSLAEDLATKYYELSEKEGLTNDEKLEMKSLSERLVELIPELADSVNSETGAISAQKDEVYDLIEAKREQYRVEAAKEKMIEAYQNQLDAEQNLKEAIDYATEAQSKYNEKLEEYNQTQAKIQENPAEWSYLADQMDEMGLAVADAKLNWQDLVKEVDAATQALDGTQETINYLETVMENGGKNCTEGFVNGYDTDSMVGTVRDSAEQCIEAFREANDSHSPSRVYESLGKDTVDGFVLGINENTPLAVIAMQDLCETLKETFANSFLAGWKESFATWFEENGATFFSYDAWYEQFYNILLAYTDVNGEFMSEWQANMDTWWNTMVVPFFTVAQWQLFGTNMKTGIMQGFKVIVNEIGGVLNNIIAMFDEAFEKLEESMNDLIDSYNESASVLGTSTLSRVHYNSMGKINIPKLADGAVIRGGNPFIAMLGDQRRGQTNIEAPANLIRDMTMEGIERSGIISAMQSAGNNAQIILDGEVLGRLALPHILDEWKRGGYNLEIL